MMKVKEDRFTFGVSAIASTGDGEILVGSESGVIRLWRYSNRKLLHMRNYTGDDKKINFIIPYPKGKFISVNENSVIRIWKISSGDCENVLHGDGKVYQIDSIVVLPDNLLAVSGYCTPAWECFDVWDLDLGTCIFYEKEHCHRPHGMTLSTTVDAHLVVSGNCTGEISVWQVNRTDCVRINQGEIERIYSMAVLPSGEIVTGSHCLNFYTISYDKGIYKHKTLESYNVIHTIYPVAGYKILVVDQQYFSNTLKLWNCVSGDCEVLGNSRFGSEVFTDHIVLEHKGAVLSLGKNKIGIHQFSENIFHFPKKLAEIRKNARVLSQAYRTEISFFASLPKEIILKIALLTADDMNEYEKEVSENIAWNYLSK